MIVAWAPIENYRHDGGRDMQQSLPVEFPFLNATKYVQIHWLLLGQYIFNGRKETCPVK